MASPIAARFSYRDGVSDDDFEPRRRVSTPRKQPVTPIEACPNPPRIVPGTPESSPPALSLAKGGHNVTVAGVAVAMPETLLGALKHWKAELDLKYARLEEEIRCIQDEYEEMFDLVERTNKVLKRRRV